jgi:hypothetical protein
LMSTPICDTQWGETLTSVRNSRSWFMLSANSGLDVLYLMHRSVHGEASAGGTCAGDCSLSSQAGQEFGEAHNWGHGGTQMGAWRDASGGMEGRKWGRDIERER